MNRKALIWLSGLAPLLAGCEDPRFTVRKPPGERVEAFRQATVPKVDVLWVVDNSSSMEAEQKALGESFRSFFGYLDEGGADFHIGVISTDAYNPAHQGRLLGQIPILSRATPSAGEVFAKNVNVGLDGKGDEQGLRVAVLALTEPLTRTENAGFLREEAHLFVVFVSDEDDHSFGEVEYFARRIEQIKGIGNDGMVNVGAVVGDTPEVPDDCRTVKSVKPGLRYAELARLSGGLALSICQDDFAGHLDQLGFSAAGLRRVFTLAEPAIAESLTVWIKTACDKSPLPPSACENAWNDCAGRSSDVYGQVCVVRAAPQDGFGFDEKSRSVRLTGQAVPPFGSVVEVGYVPQEER